MRRSILIGAILLWVQAYLLGPELLKLPLLITHFVEHRTGEEDLSFSHYLENHYADLSHEEDCDNEHGDLPYHHHHGASTDQCTIKLYDSDPVNAVSFSPLIARSATPITIDPGLLSGHNTELLRPPRTLA